MCPPLRSPPVPVRRRVPLRESRYRGSLATQWGGEGRGRVSPVELWRTQQQKLKRDQCLFLKDLRYAIGRGLTTDLSTAPLPPMCDLFANPRTYSVHTCSSCRQPTKRDAYTAFSFLGFFTTAAIASTLQGVYSAPLGSVEYLVGCVRVSGVCIP